MLACGAFGADEPRKDEDAGADAPSASADAGAALDADGSSPATTCASNPSALFCDDFEQPGRTIPPLASATAQPWDVWQSIGSQVASLSAGGTSPNAFWVAGAMVNGDRSRFVRSLDIRGKRIRWTFEMNVKKLVQQFAGLTSRLGFATFSFEGDKSIRFVLSKNADGVTLDGAAIHNLGASTVTAAFTRPAVPAALGTWEPFTIEFEPLSGVDRFTVYVRDVVLLTLPLDPPGPGAISIGADLSNTENLSSCEVGFDNVVVTTF